MAIGLERIRVPLRQFGRTLSYVVVHYHWQQHELSLRPATLPFSAKRRGSAGFFRNMRLSRWPQASETRVPDNKAADFWNGSCSVTTRVG